MSKRKKRGNGDGTIAKRGKSWRFEILINGKRESKSVKMADFGSMQERNDAFAQWKIDLRTKAKALTGEAPAITTIGQLLEKFMALQFRKKLEGATNLASMVRRYMIPRLGHVDARTPHLLAIVDEYVEGRQDEKTKRKTPVRNQTINLEISYLKSALRLLRPEPRYFQYKKLDTRDGVRRGLVTVEEYHELLRELEEYQKPVWCFSYHVGRRRGELLKLRREWAFESLTTGVLEVPGWHGPMRITKNGEDSYIPIYSESMRAFLRWALETGDPNCPFLFQHRGKRIKDQTYYKAFKRAEARLGMKHIHFHDTRRTAVTNMIEAGIEEADAMAVSGHLDPRAFRRYRISTKVKARASVLQVGERMKAWHAEKNISAAYYAKVTPDEQNGGGGAVGLLGDKPN